MQAEQIQNSCCKNNGNVKYEFYLYISKLIHSYIMLNNLPRISRWALMFGGSGSFVFVKVNSICFKWHFSPCDWYRINIFTLFTRTLHIQCMWNLKVTIKKFCRSEINLIRFTKSSLQIACKLMCLHIETAFAHWNSICSSKLQVATKLSFENSSGVCEWDFFLQKMFLRNGWMFYKNNYKWKADLENSRWIFYLCLAKLVSETTIWTWFSAGSSMWLQNLDADSFVSNFLAQ